MNSTTTMASLVRCIFLCVILCVPIWDTMAGNVVSSTEAEQIQKKKDASVKTRREAIEKAKAKLQEEISEIDLPEDTTQRISVKEIRISGNTLLTTDELLADMPLIYNASTETLKMAESDNLYDFRALHDIILEPGQARQVSTRTIQGFTQYLLSVYQDKNYAGIYVYVPANTMREGRELQDEILLLKVIEAPVSAITTT